MAGSRAKPWVVDDQLWELVEPLLPQPVRHFRYPGRRRLDDRLVLQGILFVLHTGIGWEHLPPGLGFGVGMTAWRRLHEWQDAGVWDKLHLVLLERLHAAGEIDWSRAVVDASYVQAKRGRLARAEPGRPRPAGRQAPPPDRRARPAAAWSVTGANRNDVTQLIALVDAIPLVRGPRGRPATQ
jgi:transposase